MKKSLRFLFLVIPILLFPRYVMAANTASHEKTEIKLNRVVAYTNQIIEDLWLLHKTIPISAHTYSDASSPKAEPSFQVLTKREKPYLELWHQLSQEKLPIPKIRELLAEQENLLDQLEDRYWHLKNQAISLNSEQFETYVSLIAADYESIRLLHDSLRQQLKQAHNQLLQQAQPRPEFVQAASLLRELVFSGREILKSLQTAEQASIFNKLVRLKKVIALCEQYRSEKLSVYMDAQVQLVAVIKQAKMIVSFTEEYLYAPNLPPSFSKYPASYFYFNAKIGNKFSRKGESLVAQYNRFVAIDSFAILQEIGELNWILPPETQAMKGIKHYIFLVDVSGSMVKKEKLPAFKSSLALLLQNLQQDDLISILSFAADSKHILPPTQVRQKHLIRQQLDGLEIGGESLPLNGFKQAYELAHLKLADCHQTEIIVVSDGGFEIANTLPEFLKQASHPEIELAICYVGQYEQIVKKRLQNLARLAKGRYIAIGTHSSEQFSKLFAQP